MKLMPNPSVDLYLVYSDRYYSSSVCSDDDLYHIPHTQLSTLDRHCEDTEHHLVYGHLQPYVVHTCCSIQLWPCISKH